MKLVVNPLYNSWQEGVGLDLEGYRDETRGNEGSNWMKRANTPGVAEITMFTFTSDTKSDYGSDTVDGKGVNYIKLYNGSGPDATARFNVWFNDGSGDVEPVADGTEVQVNIASAANKEAIAEAFRAAVDGLTSNFDATRTGAVVMVTNKVLGPSTHASIQGVLGDIDIAISQKGTQETPWHSVSGGGDAGGIANYGMGIKLTSSQEALNYSSQVKASSAPSVQNIPDGATTSYYTKRFFARGTEFFFKRPRIHAVWDSSRRDQRGQFHISSSLASGENINDIYFYNYVRGRLRSIPSSDSLTVSIYSSSAGLPTSTRLRIKNATKPGVYADSVTATEVETGVYKARLQVVDKLTTLHDVWSLGSEQIHTGTILTTALSTAVHAREPSYRLSITNLQNSYTPKQVARFNLYVREKNWNPTIYTKAIASAPTISIPTASYRVVREYDNLEAVSHDTGSGLLGTGLSYDISGNYFDFDMSLLEPDYEYCFKFAFYDEELDSWQEQNESFKFRVNKNEY
jgi:hypothetical protein